MIGLTYREANSQDEAIYLNWANDPDVRKNSFNQNIILPEQHHRWFQNKLSEKATLLLVFINDKNNFVGQVRIDKSEYLQVDISIDVLYRGKGYAVHMITLAVNEYGNRFGKNHIIYSLIREENILSIKTFEKVGFKMKEFDTIKNCFIYTFTT